MQCSDEVEEVVKKTKYYKNENESVSDTLCFRVKNRGINDGY